MIKPVLPLLCTAHCILPDVPFALCVLYCPDLNKATKLVVKPQSYYRLTWCSSFYGTGSSFHWVSAQLCISCSSFHWCQYFVVSLHSSYFLQIWQLFSLHKLNLSPFPNNSSISEAHLLFLILQIIMWKISFYFPFICFAFRITESHSLGWKGP